MLSREISLQKNPTFGIASRHPFWNEGSAARPLSVTLYWPTWSWPKAWHSAGSVVRFHAFLVWFFVWKCRRVLSLVVQIDRVKNQKLPCWNKMLAEMWLHQLHRNRTFYDKTLKSVYVCNMKFLAIESLRISLKFNISAARGQQAVGLGPLI